MAFRAHVFGAGKLLLLCGALVATFFVSFAIAMRVAVRTRDVVVPNIVGRSVNEASLLLTDLGLSLKEEGRRIDPTIPADRILAQDPAAGSAARRPRSVRVWLSAGNRVAVVPSVIGEAERTAQMRLQGDALDVASIAEVRSSDYPPDVVVGQSPPPNSAGTSVALLVNRGERSGSFVMPDLIGVNGDRAADVLRSQGFRVAVVGDHPYPGIPPRIVIRQYPRGGFQIAAGEPIALEVSQ